MNVTYDEWVEEFDNDEALTSSAKGIKVILRGISKDIPKKR